MLTTCRAARRGLQLLGDDGGVWWRCAAGTLTLVLLAGCLSSPSRPPIVTPPRPTTHVATVRVFLGDPARDEKAVGATVTIAGRTLAADGAGNVTVVGLSAGSYEACAEQAGWKKGCASGPVPGPAIDLSLERAVAPTLPLRIDGQFWTTDAGPFRPLFASGLTLLARPPPDRAEFLDQVAALGFNGVRVFAGHLGWAGQTPESARAALPALLDEAAARGLYVYVCAITGGRDPVYDVRTHLREVAALVARHPNSLLEVANEIGHDSLVQLSPAEFLAMARDVIPIDVVWSLGAPDGPFKTDEPKPDGTYPTAGGRFNDAHLDRGRDLYNQVRRLREIYAIAETQRAPAMNGEPIGIAEVPMPGKQRFWGDDALRFSYAMGALCRGFELGCVWHSEQGLHAQPFGSNTTAAARAFIDGWRAIDTDQRLTYINAGWANSPVTAANFDTGLVRAYSFVTGSRGWTVLVGLRGDPAVTWGGGWSPVRVAADRPGLRIVEIAR